MKRVGYVVLTCPSFPRHALIRRSFLQVPAVAVGILLGPIASKFIDSDRWGSGLGEGQRNPITLVRRHSPVTMAQLPTAQSVSNTVGDDWEYRA